jgi:hypothetical protein
VTEKNQAIVEKDNAMTQLPILIKAAEHEARHAEHQ